jgi:hypothetical protein
MTESIDTKLLTTHFKICSRCPIMQDAINKEQLNNLDAIIPPKIIEPKVPQPPYNKDNMPIPKPKYESITHRWNRFLIKFMSKRFQTPFLYLLDNFYNSKTPEYISVFNLYTELIKKDFRHNYFIENHGIIKQKVKPIIKLKPKDLPIAPPIKPEENGIINYYDSENFISFSKLEKQDNFIKNIGDSL